MINNIKLKEKAILFLVCIEKALSLRAKQEFMGGGANV